MSKWESLQLNKIAGLVMGQSPSSDSYNTEGEGMPFFQGKSDFGKVNPKIRMYCKSPKKLAHKNDILLSVRAPVGDVNIAEGTCCIGRGLAAISGQKEKSYSKYIYYYLLWKKKELENIGVGSTFKAIGKKDIEKILIPLASTSRYSKETSYCSGYCQCAHRKTQRANRKIGFVN